MYPMVTTVSKASIGAPKKYSHAGTVESRQELERTCSLIFGFFGFFLAKGSPLLTEKVSKRYAPVLLSFAIAALVMLFGSVAAAKTSVGALYVFKSVDKYLRITLRGGAPASASASTAPWATSSTSIV